MGAMTLFFSSAALGLPGLANFVGEFMVLSGAFRVNPVIAALGSLGLVIAPVYSLILIQRTFHGEPGPHIGIRDLGKREMTALASLVIATIAMGIYPQPLIDRTEPVISLNTIKPVMAKGEL
jgi:NADH-quinone oxidoreductase subunit M